MIRATPTFTRAMRGYDIEEVDEYVDALRDSEDQHAEVLAAAEAANTALLAQVDRLTSRVSELESCIRSETPRSIAALGERLTLVLEEAEQGATDAVRVAKEEADALLAAARATAEEERLLSAARRADAEQRAAARIAGAEDTARTTELLARQRADEIVADAERRALARRQEIEAWVERVRAHVEGEERRAAEEFARVRALRGAELDQLGRRREAMFASLEEMAEGLRATVASARATTERATVELPGSTPAPQLVEAATDAEATTVPAAEATSGTAAEAPSGTEEEGTAAPAPERPLAADGTVADRTAADSTVADSTEEDAPTIVIASSDAPFDVEAVDRSERHPGFYNN